MNLTRILSAGILAAIVTAGSVFMACSSDAPDVEGVPFLVGVSQANLSEPWRIAMTEDIKAEASLHGDLKMIYADASDSSELQIADVNRLLAFGIDLLIISPTDSKALTPAVREAYARIPVIVVDRAVEGYDYTLFIGPDNERLGKEAGVAIAGLLGPGGGTILEIQGRSGSPPAIDRSSGFRNALASQPGVTLLPPLVADWLRDTAEDEFAAGVGSMPPIDVVFAQNDAMAYGAWRAARSAGRTGIRFIGIDGLPGKMGGIELVQQGILTATFTCPTGGRDAVIAAMDILLHKEGIPKKIFLRPGWITKDSLGADGSNSRPQKIEGGSSGNPIRLGFAQVGAESEWRIANTESIKSAASKAGIELLFESAEQRPEHQIEAIRSFIRAKVDVIAFSPVVESGWEDVLREAKTAGIPVILTDRKVRLNDDSLWLTFMGSDFIEEGRRSARWLVENMNTAAPVNIVELRGTIGSAPAIDRKIGFEEVISDYPNFSIVESESAGFFKDQGYEVMKDILGRLEARGIRMHALFAHNDDMAVGAIMAIEEYGRKPGKDVIIVSIDAAHGAFLAMIAGKLNCTVECNPLLGPQLMKAVIDYMDGKDLPLRMITAEGVFPASSARAALSGRKY